MKADEQSSNRPGLPSCSSDQSAFALSGLRRDSPLAYLALLDKLRRLVGSRGFEPPDPNPPVLCRQIYSLLRGKEPVVRVGGLEPPTSCV